MTALTIRPSERDALQEELLMGLSGIGDVWLAVAGQHIEEAARLGRAYSDYLRVILDDLGWANGPTEEVVELRAPNDVWGRVLTRLSDEAEAHLTCLEAERDDVGRRESQAEAVLSICTHLLERIAPNDGASNKSEFRSAGTWRVSVASLFPWPGRRRDR